MDCLVIKCTDAAYESAPNIIRKVRLQIYHAKMAQVYYFFFSSRVTSADTIYPPLEGLINFTWSHTLQFWVNKP
jgi:hypothetical protein